MIGSGNLLSQVTVGLLRSLLACCPGATNSGIDLKQEYHSVILLTDKTDGVTQTHNLANFSDEARHRFITGLYISKLLLLLMKKFRLNHYMQAEYLSQLINDANGILVLLKFLNLESIDLCKLPIFPYMGEISRDLLIEECLSQMMILCYKVTKGHPDRIQANLIQFKSSLIFKKLLSKFPNTSLEIPCLKMLRIQIKYLTKKWKNYPSNMKVISEIYQKLKPCKEDWISDVPIEKPNSEEIRQKNYEFNYENYWRASENIPPDSPKIPQDFSEMYEEWLEENVWGYSYMY